MASKKTPAAKSPDAGAAKSLPGLLRSVLASPQSEQVVKSQMLALARKNLHLPDVAVALLESLPKVKDKETRDSLLDLVGSIETSRFESVEALHDAFIEVFKSEKERAMRTALMTRLADGIHQDERLAGFFLEILGEKILNDQERQAAVDAVAGLASVSEKTAILALERCQGGDAAIQATAVSVAERCADWGDGIVKALGPYLDIKRDRSLRQRILDRLAKAKKLAPSYVPLLVRTLRQDPDEGARASALETIQAIKPWNDEVLEQLLWTASQDASTRLRKRAVAIRAAGPELSEEQLRALASRLGSDRSAGVRTALIEVLKDYARVPAVRAAVAEAFGAGASSLDDAEFTSIVEFLAPYAGRDAEIRDRLMKAAETLPKAGQRKAVLDLVLPKIKPDTAVDSLVRLFKKERDASIRGSLFTLLKPLSVAKHAALVKLFCAELVEPSSPFRLDCASALVTSPESHDEIVEAFEDVLENDTDRELIRTCLDGYLRPKVEKSFDVLVAVVRNEGVDTGSRQRCLDEILALDLSAAQQKELTAVLSGIKPGTLKTSE